MYNGLKGGQGQAINLDKIEMNVEVDEKLLMFPGDAPTTQPTSAPTSQPATAPTSQPSGNNK